MTLSTLFSQINGVFRGTDDNAPSAGTLDYIYWAGVTNRKLSEYVNDGKQTRASLFEVRNIGVVRAGVQNYDLDSDILLPADKVIITTLANGDVNYTLCKPQERDRYLRSCYVAGRDPQILTFSSTIATTDIIVGGAINLAGYWVPDDLANANDTVPVDDPYWLVYAVAAELAFNELTYASKANDLNEKANSLYAQMSSNNRRGTSGNPRTIITTVRRIPGTSSNSVGRF